MLQTLEAIDQYLDSVVYILLIIVLVVTAVHADRRYDEERSRNEALERRIRSLSLVVRFQQSLVDAQLPEPETTPTTVGEAEVVDLSVDGLISRMGYCLTCHRLKAPSHFQQTDHLRLEDDSLVHGPSPERH